MAPSDYKYRTLVTGKVFADMRGKGLSDRAKVLTLYILLGNDVGNRIGLFPINFPGIAHANDWPQKTSVERKALEKDFLDVCECFGWQYDEIAEVLFIRSHFKYCPMHHGLQLIGCLKDLSCLPETYLVHVWAENAKTLIKRETNPKPTKENPHPKPTNLHTIFDRIVGPILAKIPKPDGAPAPAPEAPDEEPESETEPRVFSEVVERLYARGIEVFSANKQSKPKDASAVMGQKKALVLILKHEDSETVESVLNYLEREGKRVKPGSNDFNWAPNCRSFVSFSGKCKGGETKWDLIRPLALNQNPPKKASEKKKSRDNYRCATCGDIFPLLEGDPMGTDLCVKCDATWAEKEKAQEGK